ncbi:MAG TPA: LamG-like jellyroll fold domain-containing protein [Kofleriaceae bacterium]|nr:LamG-like jellyroll fold domain-containing protein [Kofleriaceae bacterium]
MGRPWSWIVPTLMLASGCDMVLGLNAFTSTPRHRKPISITQQLAVPLTDFSVSVLLADDPDLAALAGTGTDLAFTDADGVALDCEIVNYSAGNLEAWVRVPAIPPGGVTIEMVYGAGAGSCTGSATWRPFIGVWHEPDASGVFHDRTLHGHHTSPSTMAMAPTVVAGIVGNAGSFDGIDDATCEPVDADQSLELGTSSFSYSIWVNIEHGASSEVVLRKGGEQATTPGFDFELGSGLWTARVADGTTVKANDLVSQVLGQWVQLVAVVDRDKPAFTTYANGVVRDTQTLASFGSVSGSAQFCLGKLPSAQFAGTIDEPRIYSTALTPDWIAAEYANLTARSTFMSLGSDEAY